MENCKQLVSQTFEHFAAHAYNDVRHKPDIKTFIVRKWLVFCLYLVTYCRRLGSNTVIAETFQGDEDLHPLALISCGHRIMEI